jgi:hypothetical protein
MKTMKNILLFLGFVAALSFMACDTPLALGDKLDVEGPVVEFISPKPRKVVTGEFTIEGSARDAGSVEKVLLRITQDREDLPKQWCYEKGKWTVSEDYGASWADFEGGVWIGNNKEGTFTIDINMAVGGQAPDDGEYLFILQAWDKGNFSDDNSIKMLVLIIDTHPPSVEIPNPYLYRLSDPYFAELESLAGYEWRAPERIGKLQTRAFLTQWQLNDSHDLWSFDLRFYDRDVEVDGVPETDLPANYYYTYHQNVPAPTEEPDPLYYIRPNGSVLVPALESPPGDYGDRGTIARSVTGKTTIKVVAICYDAAGQPNEERTLGYFIYWPQADFPWITYAAGMYPLSEHLGNTVTETVKNIKDNAFMIYPDRTISANAFHYHGLKEVTYSLYLYNETSGAETPISGHTNITKTNTPRGDAYPTGFPWNFKPPLQPGIYIIRAIPKALDNKPGDVYEAVFRIQDTTFPIFPTPPSPPASEPFFLYLNAANTAFTISGTVNDAASITDLCLVWINPQSKDYAAMAQLEYFRDHTYAGWRQAQNLAVGGSENEDADKVPPPGVSSEEDYPFDTAAPNRLWRLPLTNPRTDPETQRTIYDYSVTINLADHLKIGMSAESLKSQVFLLRARNPDNRATVITYAPQGDTVRPSISIDRVDVRRDGATLDTVYPIGKGPLGYDYNKQIPILKANDTIVITGSWGDDTATKLPVQTYLFPNMSFAIGNVSFKDNLPGGITLTRTPNGTPTDGKGTFTINATVGTAETSPIKLAALKDTLVVSAWVKDFGGNESDDSASWLVQTDVLSLQRISSEDQDKAYKAGDKIEIFLEFNKPVMLKNRTTTPTLTLNTTGTALFGRKDQSPQDTENTRQYFTYTVQPGHATSGLYLDVSTIADTNNAQPTYPFSWVHTLPASTEQEEIRILAPTTTPPPGATYATANLPSNSSGPNSDRSLLKNKQIEIDTVAPTLTGIKGTEGWHGVDKQIYITATFSEPVKIDTTSNNTVPYLTFVGIANTPATGVGVTSRNVNDVRVVNGSTITFVYTVRAGDNTTNTLVVNDIEGVITDVPGTAFVPGNATTAQKTLTGVYIDTTKPPIPTVQVLNPSSVPVASITSNVDNGTIVTADSSLGTGDINLKNVYVDNLRLNVNPNSTNTNRDSYRVEYSANNGTSWSVYPGEINWGPTDPNGAYQITARQIDRAGNISDTSRPIVFNWDKGAMVTSINSTTPNGTYTYNDNKKDSISITVNFRKPLSFSTTPSIRLNTNNGAERATDIEPTGFTAGTGTYSSLTFTYNVAAGHSTNTQPLNVTRLYRGTGNVRDADRVAISTPTDLFVLPPVGSQLPAFKTITVDTTDLTVTTTAALTTGTVNADNAYNTTLTVTFNQSLIRGSGDISIIQTVESFRLPAVLTAAERTRYRTANTASGGTSMETLFDEFYTQGINGLNNDGTPDTSIKYILSYDVYPNRVVANANGTNIQKLAEAFRQAEKLTFSATSNVVSFAPGGGTDRQLVVTLSGSNALRVPGGSYVVTIPADFVRNGLSRPSTEITATLTAGGVARPFIRVKKTQETIDSINVSNNAPRIVATQPLQTTAKIDTRTPIINNATPGAYVGAARIRYSPATATRAYPDSGNNWWTTELNANPQVKNNLPAAPATPAYDGGTDLAANGEIPIGNTEYQGFIWRAVARAFSNATTASDPSNEAAYRTVFTYQIVNMANPTDTSQQRLTLGDQIWLRGGDAIGTSTVPGYPLTWVDDWNDLRGDGTVGYGKRAGIRLMTLTDGGATYNNNSTWKWVSWEITVETSFDIILGRRADGDPATTAELEQIRQYGPRQWAYQRAGWTSFKERYTLVPGNHRWVTTAINANNLPNDANSKGAVNFSNTWSGRPILGATWIP